jgi:hypothetical protein
MKQIKYSRKINQFRNTARQINELIEEGRWHSMSAPPQRQLQWKLNNLFATVKNLLSRKELKRILASAAFLICISSVNAQTFAPVTVNPFGLTQVSHIAFPSLTDIDNDGDFDLLVSEYPGLFEYFENIGTPSSPNFAAPVLGPFGLATPDPGSFSHATADLDNDGDLDILIGEYYGTMDYYQNNGTAAIPAYGYAGTNPFGLDSANQQAFPAFGDFDNDGDFDLLVDEYYGSLRYFENVGTASLPNFTTPLQNPFGLTQTGTTSIPAIADVDNDGDLDIFAGNYYGNLAYYQNTGTNVSPSFAAYQLNPFGLTSTAPLAAPTLADLDNDGDIDLLVGDSLGNFSYFENTVIGSVGDIGSNSVSFSVSPNPASEHTTISTNSLIQNCDIKITAIDGKLIYHTIASNNKTVINTSGLSKGVYIIELSSGNTVSRKKMIIE